MIFEESKLWSEKHCSAGVARFQGAYLGLLCLRVQSHLAENLLLWLQSLDLTRLIPHRLTSFYVPNVEGRQVALLLLLFAKFILYGEWRLSPLLTGGGVCKTLLHPYLTPQNANM